MIEAWFPNVDWDKMNEATMETLYMTLMAVAMTFVLGILLGLLLFLTSQGHVWQNKLVNLLVSVVVNVFRSIPFIILIVLLLPFTKFLIDTVRGPNAALPSLIIGSAPFYARLVEIGLREVDKGVLEAAKAMGAKTSTVIWKVLLPESMPALISGITVTAIALVGFTAMAGVIGAGGLGNLAYLEGFQRAQEDVTLMATILILVIVFAIQAVGDVLTRFIDKR
ncbi:methionine ABC transporter permease [Bacillus fonticola]|uniref:methionine ABC transporter permease n=1 Tax=Bacillus fonticola TaxID=2728853 RepID=UPI0014750F8C|nr:methionine ABC transporter permease [Bacillus fonticola]